MIKKKAVAGGIVALAAVLGGGGIFAWTRRTADTETLADNQKYVYAYVTSIEGNELTYMEVDESVVEAYRCKQHGRHREYRKRRRWLGSTRGK